ncbi:MAG: CvpA family protein, partial [Clostridia bacterium]|nr:CvpA family protein [Clostridia bacterium]
MLDIIFIICLAVAFFIGYKTGFLRALVGFLGIIVSAVGGYLLYPYVTPILMKTPLYDFFNNWVLKGLDRYLSQNETISQMEALFQKYNVADTEALRQGMATGITTVLMNIVSILLIIVVIKLFVLVLKKATHIINHIPVIGLINRLFGMILTGASFVTVCFIVVAVMLLPPSNTSEISRKACQEIDQSFVVREVMDYNFF